MCYDITANIRTVSGNILRKDKRMMSFLKKKVQKFRKIKEEIEEELKKNHEQGIEQGRINQLIDLVMQNLLPIETAAQCANMTLDEFKVAMEKNEN